MQLTRHTDYALRVLVFLGLRGTAATVADIAVYYRISHHHIVKVVQRLADCGFVVARRGRGGGVALARAAEDINIGDVIRQLEPDFALVECQHEGGRHCRIEGACALQSFLDDAVARFFDEIGRHSLADVLAPMRGLISPEALVRNRLRAASSRC